MSWYRRNKPGLVGKGFLYIPSKSTRSSLRNLPHIVLGCSLSDSQYSHTLNSPTITCFLQVLIMNRHIELIMEFRGTLV